VLVHGTATAWRLGCRCGRCRRGLRAAAKVWWATRQLKRGRVPASYVPADRVRRHVEALRAVGWTSRRIAEAAGVSPATVSRIRKPGTRWCSRIVAGAVLALEP
jgi:hypothetical protein